MGVAGVGEDVAERDACRGHRGQHGDQGADRVVPARREGGAAGELGDGAAVLVGHHDGGRQVVAVEQLVLAAQQVVLAVPQDASGSAQSPPLARRGPGEGLQVRPVRGQRRAGTLEFLRDRCLEQVVADALQRAGGQPVWLAAEGVRDQAEGVLGLPVGQPVRAGFQSASTPSRCWSSSCRLISAWCTRVR